MVVRTSFLGALLTIGGIAGLASCATSPSPAAGWQSWSPQQQASWYSATQGSRLMPLAWMLALEKPDSAAPFLGPESIKAWRLLPKADPATRLPVGFVVDDNNDTNLTVSKLRWFAGQAPTEKWVGLNCSACHTAELTYQGTALRVDGGPSLFDFQSFIENLDAAIRATADAPEPSEKWTRFARAALGEARNTPDNRVMLRSALKQLLAWEDRVEAMNKTPLRYGYGRVDAFGHIFNKVALFNGAASPTRNPADAPVSYPHIWDISRQDKLQWNGIAQNQRLPLGAGRYLDYGALGRNAGEVLGVFGDVAVTPGGGLGGYRSSVQADNLIRLETQLAALRAPAWPVATFGALDSSKVEAGRKLFDADCKGCHAAQPGTAPYAIKLIPLKPENPNATDPWMACNAISYRSATGKLQGTPKSYVGGGEKFGADAPIAEMLETTVKGTLVGKKGQIVAQTARVFFGGGGAPRVVTEEAPDMRPLILEACFASGSPHMAYKARPLDGIWATAPYLHNGSVPTLYDLLLPAAKRPASFMMGTREYDPVRGGYATSATAPGNSFRYVTATPDGTPIPGNGNAGHDYGAGKLTEAQRLDLLEYLKSI